jgi:hypothetical protein
MRCGGTQPFSPMDNRFPLDLMLSSIVGQSIDYDFLCGPEMDATFTGTAPLPVMRRCCRNRPTARIWFWWRHEGDPEFNTNYHDVAKDLETLHQQKVHAMISVRGSLDSESETCKMLDPRHLPISGFDLYEDAEDSYDYELAQHSVIPICWNESTGILTIGGREGSSPGMVAKRSFRIMVAGSGHGVAGEVTRNADKEVN